jgi:hypothetical protein
MGRAVDFECSANYEQLMKSLHHHLEIPEDVLACEETKVLYVDDCNEEITFSSTNELQEAFSLGQVPLLIKVQLGTVQAGFTFTDGREQVYMEIPKLFSLSDLQDFLQQTFNVSARQIKFFQTPDWKLMQRDADVQLWLSLTKRILCVDAAQPALVSEVHDRSTLATNLQQDIQNAPLVLSVDVTFPKSSFSPCSLIIPISSTGAELYAQVAKHMYVPLFAFHFMNMNSFQ